MWVQIITRGKIVALAITGIAAVLANVGLPEEVATEAAEGIVAVGVFLVVGKSVVDRRRKGRFWGG